MRGMTSLRGTSASNRRKSSMNSVERCCRRTMARTVPVCPAKAASRSAVPWRTYSNSRRAGWVQQTRPQRDRAPLAGDGKAVRGARTETQAAPHLLSISTHDTHETLVPVRVDDKTNEIPVLHELLPHVPLRGRVVSADALHTQTALAQLLLDHHAAYLLTVKDNQPRLRAERAAYFTDQQATARLATTVERRRA